MYALAFKSGPVPDVGSIQYNTAYTQEVLGLGRALGVLASSAVPRYGFDQTSITLPNFAEAQITGNLLQDRALEADARTTNLIGFGKGTDLTVTLQWSDAKFKLHENLERSMAASLNPVLIDRIVNRSVAWAINNTEEAEFVTTFWTTAAWTTSYSTGTVTKWNVSTSDPIDQVNTARRAVLIASGMNPESMIMPLAVFDALTVHPRILARLPGGAGGSSTQQATKEQLMTLFRLRKLTVVDYTRNTGADLQEANKTMAFTITDGCLLYAENAGGMGMAGDAMCRAGWNALNGREGVAVRSGRNDEDGYRFSKVMRCAKYKVLHAGAGAFWEDLL